MTSVLNHIREIAYAPLEDHLPAQGEYVLLKTGRVTPWDRWSILGLDPWMKWRPTGMGNVWEEFDGVVRHAMENRSEARSTKHEARNGSHHDSCLMPHASMGCDSLPIPVVIGAIAYDAGRWIETIPATARTIINLPDMVFYGFRRYLVADERERRMYVICHRESVGDLAAGVAIPHASIAQGGLLRLPHEPRQARNDGANDWHSNFSAASYAATVDRIRAMIAAGDCYQVNLSQQIEASCSRSAEAVFREAVAANPAPMMALVNAGDFQIISTSPERLVRKRGDEIVSRPIKGTRPRGATPDKDAALKEELRSAVKDNAELAMIVDLVRNDLGRVALPGSVTVREPAVIESYANVHHLLATIAARARTEATWPAILRALFPGGSVTGCPKAQAMKVIEECEGVRRGFYCGSIGYIAANGDGDWNIAIRTMTKIGDRVVFNLGGAVTYDSDPQQEYMETLYKGTTLFRLLGMLKC